jgi:hypothetical protein
LNSTRRKKKYQKNLTIHKSHFGKRPFLGGN